MAFKSKQSKHSYLFGEDPLQASDAPSSQPRPFQEANITKQNRRRVHVLASDSDADEILFGGKPAAPVRECIAPPPLRQPPSPSPLQTPVMEAKRPSPVTPLKPSRTLEPPPSSPTRASQPAPRPQMSSPPPSRSPPLVVDQQSGSDAADTTATVTSPPAKSSLFSNIFKSKKKHSSRDTSSIQDTPASHTSTEPHVPPPRSIFRFPKQESIPRAPRLREREDEEEDEEDEEEMHQEHIPEDEATRAFALDISLRRKVKLPALAVHPAQLGGFKDTFPTPSVSTPTSANPWSDTSRFLSVLEPTATTSTPVGGRRESVRRPAVPGWTGLSDSLHEIGGNNWAEEEPSHAHLVSSLVAEQPDRGFETEADETAELTQTLGTIPFTMEDPWREE